MIFGNNQYSVTFFTLKLFQVRSVDSATEVFPANQAGKQPVLVVYHKTIRLYYPTVFKKCALVTQRRRNCTKRGK